MVKRSKNEVEVFMNKKTSLLMIALLNVTFQQVLCLEYWQHYFSPYIPSSKTLYDYAFSPYTLAGATALGTISFWYYWPYLQTQKQAAHFRKQQEDKQKRDQKYIENINAEVNTLKSVNGRNIFQELHAILYRIEDKGLKKKGITKEGLENQVDEARNKMINGLLLLAENQSHQQKINKKDLKKMSLSGLAILYHENKDEIAQIKIPDFFI